MQTSQLARDFINCYQGNFPLVERPFELIAERLDTSGQTLLDTVDDLLKRRLLSRFGPLYDAVAFGGGLTLAALSAPEDRFREIARQVNSHREVAHNYRREHALNMWFVLATETPEGIASTIASIERSTGLVVYNFPKQQEFYIGLWLDIAKGGAITTVPVPVKRTLHSFNCAIDGIDRKIISATQSGLPVVGKPYHAIAELTATTPNEVMHRLQKLLSGGVIRRIGAVPNHYRLGLKANGMTVWDVPDEQAQTLGEIVGQLDFVSHCYLRPRHEDLWPYNLFAMVHGHTHCQVNKKFMQIKNILGQHNRASEVLFSSAILKKTGIRLAA